ncbi:hypothetical protein PENSPDRAFT_694714 [Peniophora sp. CONT]|nr:hypothetical protein PENSPDRAFT_694714 [Peniophora sp. CONT]
MSRRAWSGRGGSGDNRRPPSQPPRDGSGPSYSGRGRFHHGDRAGRTRGRGRGRGVPREGPVPLGAQPDSRPLPLAPIGDLRRLDTDWDSWALYPQLPEPPRHLPPPHALGIRRSQPTDDEYGRFIASLHDYLDNRPTHAQITESEFLEGQTEMEISFSRGPYGRFVDFGQRNPWPATDPGPSPFDVEARVPGDDHRFFRGDDQGQSPGRLWFEPARVETMARIGPPTRENLCPLWAWQLDDRLFVTARHRTPDEDALYTLHSRGYAVLTRISRDVVALARGASLLFNWDTSGEVYDLPVFPPPVGPLLRREDLIVWMDGWRDRVQRLLAWAVLLLRAAPASDRVRLAPSGWTYPSHPDLSFYAAATAYGVWSAPLVGVIFDGTMPASMWPPLSHPEFGRLPFSWVIPHAVAVPDSSVLAFDWLDPIWDGWTHSHDLESSTMNPTTRTAIEDSIRSTADVARFGPWREFYLVRGSRSSSTNNRFWSMVREGRRDWTGISISRISDREVRRRHLHDRMYIMRHFPYPDMLTFLEWTDRNRTQPWAAEMFDSDVESDSDEDSDTGLPAMVPVRSSASLTPYHPVAPYHPGESYATYPPSRFIAPVGELVPEWRTTLFTYFDRHHRQPPSAHPPSPPTRQDDSDDHRVAGSPIQPERDPSPHDRGRSSAAPLVEPGLIETRRGRRSVSMTSAVSLGDDRPLEDEPMSVDDDRGESRKRRRSGSPPPARPAPAPPARSRSPSAAAHSDEEASIAEADPKPDVKGKGKARGPDASKKRRQRRAKLAAIVKASYLSKQPRAQAATSSAAGPSSAPQQPVVPSWVEEDDTDSDEDTDAAEPDEDVDHQEPGLLERLQLNIRGAAARDAALPNLARRMDGAPVSLLPASSSSQPALSSHSHTERVTAPTHGPTRRPMPRSPGWTAPAARWSSSELPEQPRDFGAEMSALSPRVLSSVPGTRWPRILLPEPESMDPMSGVLVLSRQALLRQRRWLADHADGSNDEFVRWMLRRGVRWDWGVRNRLPGPSVVQAFEAAPDAPPSWDDWVVQIGELLAQPRARQFIRDGGIAWRLALEFGPATLAAAALEGPSREARLPLPGEVGLDSSFVVDRPTTEDYELLVGRAAGRSWWPHPDEWDASMGPGEWTLGLERWFQSRLRGLSMVDGEETSDARETLRDGAWRAHIARALHARERRLLSRGEGRASSALMDLDGLTDAMRRLDLDSEPAGRHQL